MTISLIFCLCVVLLLVACVVTLLLTMRKMQTRQNDMEERIQQMNEMNAKLWSNRHDYLNNMQIVYGMVEMEEYEELHAFLEPMYKDMMKTSKALKTAIPAVNALLMAKASEAEKQGVDFYIEVKSNLKKLTISDWELCRILANLIDNAMRAVSEQEKGRILVDINEDAKNCIFTITDNGVEIPENIRGEIFKQGFTTKKQDGHGMGLYIVSRLVEKNEGKIELRTEQGEKAFQVTFPKGGSV